MDQIPDEYRGNRCVAVLIKPAGSIWQYYIRTGDSIQAMEKDLEDSRHLYAHSFVMPPDHPIPELKDRFIAKFEQVNSGFLELVIDKVEKLNVSKTAKSTPPDNIVLDDILAMQKKKGPAKTEKDSTIPGI